MRTTVTLDPDVDAKLRQTMQQRGCSFKTALNDALRSGLGGGAPASRRFRVRAQPMGLRPGINIDKALTLASEMEDAEIVRKLELGK